jgi:hypothetical protein
LYLVDAYQALHVDICKRQSERMSHFEVLGMEVNSRRGVNDVRLNILDQRSQEMVQRVDTPLAFRKTKPFEAIYSHEARGVGRLVTSQQRHLNGVGNCPRAPTVGSDRHADNVTGFDVPKHGADATDRFVIRVRCND